jgi:hypothetical protein
MKDLKTAMNLADNARRERVNSDPALEEFEERAAIIEFCGNVPRADAERIAADQIRDAKLKRQWKVEQGELASVWR